MTTPITSPPSLRAAAEALVRAYDERGGHVDRSIETLRAALQSEATAPPLSDAESSK